MKRTVILLLLTLGFQSFSQIPNQKLAPPLQAQLPKLEQRTHAPLLWTVRVKDAGAFRQILKEQQLSDRLERTYPPANVFVLQLTLAELRTKILPAETVTFVDRAERAVHEELELNSFDISANRVNLVHSTYPGLNGSGLTVSVKENIFDLEDIDLAERIKLSDAASEFLATHATIMATIIGGAGNSFYSGKGVAWGTTFTSASFSNLLPEPELYYQNQDVSVQNHSYGVGIENYYGNDATAYDASVYNNPKLLHVFSAGNRGNLVDTLGDYKNIEGFANLTGSFKMSKNTIAVGAMDSLGSVPVLSSRGPAHDGRLKPELVAFGLDGSSGAAATVSGIGLLLQQAYRDQFGRLPSAALIKAMLINSAEDVLTPGIDFVSGYGKVNAWRAVQTLQSGHFFEGNVANAAEQNFQITLPEDARNLKITLTWSDPPAEPGNDRALVNDLDLQLKHGTQVWLPWVLNAFPHADSLALPPARRVDRLNNVEQITIAGPEAGPYEIQVRGFELATLNQDFYIAYQYDTLGHFQWTFPAQGDQLVAEQTAIIRWESTGLEAPATLQFSPDKGADWQVIAEDVNLKTGYARWQVPDHFGTGQLRLVTADTIFNTGQFTISTPLRMQVGFDCPDSILLFWNAEKRASSYQVFGLEGAYLAPIATTTDTFIILQKQNFPALHYAVAPGIDNEGVGLRSQAINYTRQGVACYVSSFLADLNVDIVTLHLSLGSLYQVTRVDFEKWDGTSFHAIGSISAPDQLQLSFNDENLKAGINTYRARVWLANGGSTLSESVDKLYAGDTGYLLFPNPVSYAEDVILLTREPAGQTFLLFDALGRKVLTYSISGDFEVIPLGTIASGLYFYTIERAGKRDAAGKLLIRP